VDGVAVGEGRYGLLAQFSPDTVSTGPGATAVYTVTLSNVGDVGERVGLSVDGPAGWTTRLTNLGAPVSELDLPALLFNSTDLQLLVTPAADAAPGSYPITLTAQSLNHPGVEAVAVATAQVTGRGVTVAITPDNPVVDPTGPATWDVTVTNTGAQADTFDLTVSGAPALAGQLAADSVTLNPGAAATVQLTADNLRFLLAGQQSFAVVAQSQADAGIRAADDAAFTVAGFDEVAAEFRPESRTVTNTLSAGLTLVISNTGNVLAEYEVAFSGAGVTVTTEVGLEAISIPAGSAVVLPLQVAAASPGASQLEGTVTAAGSAATAFATADVTFVVDDTNQAPAVTAATDFTVLIGEQVSGILATFTDANPSDVHTAEIDWGDGTVTAGVVDQAAGTVSGSHTYAEAGQYTVTITVSDDQEGVGSDVLTVIVELRYIYLPIVIRDG
jgi:PKD repeat protein